MNAFLDYLEYVWNQLASIRIIDILDIMIVALLLFWLIKFVRGRRAGKLLLGVGVLFLLLLVSSLLDMRALNFILNSVVSVGLIAIVIVFQPELRSALEKVGGLSDNFKGRMDSDEASVVRSAIGEISVAAEELSKTKTGALIVFERNTRLGDVIRTGTTVDAVASSFLLGNIFYNKAPMHDGAVIIRKGRVHAAGCFLPLSANSNIVKELGTRHRAAIGMSENSDAIVLVVSEETGGISVAVDGNLNRNISRSELEEYLVSQLLDENKKNITQVVKGKFFKKGGDGKDEQK
ncbi:MAG: TIGR00159 family protein [Ruminococcaceae bacterium]|nr:TIGR00159 family protein [Oscillospiraceae bacterium]